MRTITRPTYAVVVAREREERLVAARVKKGIRESVIELNESGEKSTFCRAKLGAKRLQRSKPVDDQRRL